jgi:hypothetical protein
MQTFGTENPEIVYANKEGQMKNQGHFISIKGTSNI